jgi:hypothetical protein
MSDTMSQGNINPRLWSAEHPDSGWGRPLASQSTLTRERQANPTTPATPKVTLSQTIQQSNAAQSAIQSGESGYWQNASGVQRGVTHLNQAIRNYLADGGSKDSQIYKTMAQRLADGTKYLKSAQTSDETREPSEIGKVNTLINEIGEEFGQVAIENLPRSPGGYGGAAYVVATGNTPRAAAQNLGDVEGYYDELLKYRAGLQQRQYLRSAQGIQSTFDQIYQDFHSGTAKGINEALSVAQTGKSAGTISSTMYEDLAQMAKQAKQAVQRTYNQ